MKAAPAREASLTLNQAGSFALAALRLTSRLSFGDDFLPLAHLAAQQVANTTTSQLTAARNLTLRATNRLRCVRYTDVFSPSLSLR